jgi:hypothetical protein
MFKHLRQWAEAYIWLPASLLSIWLAAKLAYFLTGRQPEENADFIIGYAQRTVVVVLVIFLFSVSREQTGFWMTKEECIAHPYLATLQALMKMYAMGLFAYIYLH